MSAHHRLSVDPADLEIAPREVARLARTGPSEGCADAIDQAIGEARELMRPRGVWTAITAGQAEALFVEPTPVSRVAGSGPCWAFLATVGDALERRVKEHFAATRFLEGLLLDATGSVAADAMAERIEQACTGAQSSERFSPGYCHWAMAGQRPLLALLRAGELGVELLPSLLMHPLKSVSGIVVQAPERLLRIDPDECRQCGAQGCERRQARYETDPRPIADGAAGGSTSPRRTP